MYINHCSLEVTISDFFTKSLQDALFLNFEDLVIYIHFGKFDSVLFQQLLSVIPETYILCN